MTVKQILMGFVAVATLLAPVSAHGWEVRSTTRFVTDKQGKTPHPKSQSDWIRVHTETTEGVIACFTYVRSNAKGKLVGEATLWRPRPDGGSTRIASLSATAPLGSRSEQCFGTFASAQEGDLIQFDYTFKKPNKMKWISFFDLTSRATSVGHP